LRYSLQSKTNAYVGASELAVIRAGVYGSLRHAVGFPF
jgi:hypothetical protein